MPGASSGERSDDSGSGSVRLPLDVAALKAELAALEDKYFTLVSYARKAKSGPTAPTAWLQQTRAAYPAETAALAGEHGNWDHGFNSGILAAMRLVLGIVAGGSDAQMARDEFPFLDT